jgi:kynureninase
MKDEVFWLSNAKGVITDWREPNVIRLAPVPFTVLLKNMYDFGQY